MTDEAALSQLLTDYYKAFSTLNVEAVRPFFHTPGLLITPSGTFAVQSQEVFEPAMGAIMDELRNRGYTRSEFRLNGIKVLSNTAASASGMVTRFKQGDQELERAGLSYLFYIGVDGWRIAVILLHDSDRSLN